jgi:hypothetical protein
VFMCMKMMCSYNIHQIALEDSHVLVQYST